MSKRKALGKGLRSLIPDTAASVVAPAASQPAPTATPPPAEASRTGLREIDLDRIEPNRNQPRTEFSEEALEELAASLREQGVLQPVVLRPLGKDRFELIAGERRWRAAQRAGLLKLPAVVRHASDRQMLEYALVENLQREQLGPLETARAIQALMDDLALTQQEVADKIGKPRSTVANSLRLLNLQPDVQARIETGELSAGHAKVLAAIGNAAEQSSMAAEMAKRGLSVRQAEALVTTKQRPNEGSDSAEPGEAGVDPNIVAAQERLQSELGTKVRIVQRGKGGRIELHFFSHEEMERVYQRLLGRS